MGSLAHKARARQSQCPPVPRHQQNLRASLHKAERAPGTDQQQPQTKGANYYRITHPITHGNDSPIYHYGTAKHGRPLLRELLPLLGHDLQQSFAVPTILLLGRGVS